MRTSIQALIALVIVLMVVVGVYAVTSGTFESAGQNVKQGGEKSGNRLDCVLQNPSSSDSACARESDLKQKEVIENRVKQL